MRFKIILNHKLYITDGKIINTQWFCGVPLLFWITKHTDRGHYISCPNNPLRTGNPQIYTLHLLLCLGWISHNGSHVFDTKQLASFAIPPMEPMKRQNSSLSSWPSPVLSLVRNPISTGEKLTTPPEIAEKKHGQQTSRQNLPGGSPLPTSWF